MFFQDLIFFLKCYHVLYLLFKFPNKHISKCMRCNKKIRIGKIGLNLMDPGSWSPQSPVLLVVTPVMKSLWNSINSFNKSVLEIKFDLNLSYYLLNVYKKICEFFNSIFKKIWRKSSLSHILLRNAYFHFGKINLLQLVSCSIRKINSRKNITVDVFLRPFVPIIG